MLDRTYNLGDTDKLPLSLGAGEQLASYKLKTVLRHLNLSTFDYDIVKDIIYIRKEAVLLHGFTEYWFKDGGGFYYLENVTEAMNTLVRTSFYDVARQEMEKVKNNTSGELVTFDVPLVYEGGNSRWTNFLMDTVLDDEGKPSYAICYCKDIHDQKKELYRLRNIAQTDALTGLRNRSSGIFRIQARLQEEKDGKFFIAVIDLDKFKEANDLFGHSFGDMILKNVSDRIKDYFDHYTVCCRTGGDEFLLFRKCDNRAQATKILYELKKHIQHLVSYQGAAFDVKASIGFSMYPSQGLGFDELYNKADMAMYYAKNNEVDAPVFYEDTMDGIGKNRAKDR